MSIHGSEAENDLAHILEAKRHHESDSANAMQEALVQMREEFKQEEEEIQVLKEKQVIVYFHISIYSIL